MRRIWFQASVTVSSGRHPVGDVWQVVRYVEPGSFGNTDLGVRYMGVLNLQRLLKIESNT